MTTPASASSSRKPEEPARAVPGAAGSAPAPVGLVTVIVGEAGRTASSRSRSRPATTRAQGAKAAGEVAGRPGAEAKAAQASAVTQWSWQWSGDGPGPLLSGCDGEPDLTLTIGTEDARLVKEGELEASVAFMQGRLKSTGDNALLLRVLAWSTTAEFSKALSGWLDEPPG
jgi:SCP-2 sterol transfer family